MKRGIQVAVQLVFYGVCVLVFLAIASLPSLVTGPF